MKVLLVKLSSLGDVVHALPVAATLRARLPGARVAWIVERREAAVLAGHPALDEVIAVDTRRWRRVGGLRDAAGMLRAVGRAAGHVRAGRFDVAIDLQGLFKSAALAAWTRAPMRIGFAASRCREPLSARLTNRHVTPGPEVRHIVEQYLALLQPLGVTSPVIDFRLPSDPAAEARMGEFFAARGLKPRDGVVVLNPGAGRSDKQWPVARFRTLAARLSALGAHVIVVWGPGEAETAAAIAAGDGAGAVLAPPTDLLALAALLRRASVVVAADTGPLHLAAALGTPCVGLYGPTKAERNGPYGPGHRALQAPDGRMETIAVDAALAAVQALLA